MRVGQLQIPGTANNEGERRWYLASVPSKDRKAFSYLHQALRRVTASLRRQQCIVFAAFLTVLARHKSDRWCKEVAIHLQDAWFVRPAEPVSIHALRSVLPLKTDTTQIVIRTGLLGLVMRVPARPLPLFLGLWATKVRGIRRARTSATGIIRVQKRYIHRQLVQSSCTDDCCSRLNHSVYVPRQHSQPGAPQGGRQPVSVTLRCTLHSPMLRL